MMHNVIHIEHVIEEHSAESNYNRTNNISIVFVLHDISHVVFCNINGHSLFKEFSEVVGVLIVGPPTCTDCIRYIIPLFTGTYRMKEIKKRLITFEAHYKQILFVVTYARSGLVCLTIMLQRIKSRKYVYMV